MPLDIIEAKIESQSHDGRGIAIINGKTAFISGGLPGEQVACQITKKHRRYNEGQTTSILTPSPKRIEPKCSHFGICGGCSMQHLSTLDQVEFKQRVLLEQLKHFGNVIPEKILPPIIGPDWGYRRKARLGVRYVIKKGKVLVGFREKYSNFLTDVQTCEVLTPEIGTKIADLGNLIQSLTQFQQIPQIEVAVGDNISTLLFRHLEPLPESDIAKLRHFGKEHNLTIYLQPNSPEQIRKIWPDTDERLFYCLPDYDLKMHFEPLDFTQVNGAMNRLMVKQAMELLAPDENTIALDLFCGLGNFTLPIAKYAKEVTGVEGSQEMVARASENAKFNGINNAKFFAANLMAPNKEAAWFKPAYDKILIDPPRTGAKEIIPFFNHFPAKRLVYISCNPATLARDAGELVYTYRYKLKQLGMINMFPHTSHIEAIALFEK